MSRKNCLLTKQDVPQYIKDIVSRLHPVLLEHKDEKGDWWGYTFRLDAKWKCGYETQLLNDTEKLIKWCNSWYAHAKIIRYAWWQNEVRTASEYEVKGTYYHKRKALREGFRNHALLVISDPVARRFEMDGFYRD